MVSLLGLDDRYKDEGLLLRSASVLFLAYTAHNKIRRGENLDLSDAKGAVSWGMRLLRDDAAGHPKIASILTAIGTMGVVRKRSAPARAKRKSTGPPGTDGDCQDRDGSAKN